jgi:hypothetical protein
MASTYLTKSMSGNTPSTKMTFSAWIKKSSNATGFSARLFGTRLANHFYIYDNKIYLDISNSSGTNIGSVNTSRVLRDNNSFYHLVGVVDTTLSTATDRVKIYVNGERATDITVTAQVSQNATTDFGANGVEYSVGARTAAQGSAGGYFDGVMAHAHYCDGYAYQASDFGETDSTTGIWKPKTAPSVTYGTNGFFLKFENSSAFGTDSSGNGNTFTVNGTMTQTEDTPSNVFCTMNPLNAYYSGSSFSNGNLTFTTGTSQYSSDLATLGVSSGKYYWEVEFDTGGAYAHIGIKSSDDTNTSTLLGNNANDYAYRAFNGQSMTGNTSTAYGDTYAAGDIIGVALDLDNNYIYWSKNGTWQNSGDPTSGASGTGAVSITDPSSTNFGVYIPAISFNDGSATGTFKCNFGNGYFGTTAVSSAQNPDDGIGIFEYDVPTGYRALCTKSINAEEYD